MRDELRRLLTAALSLPSEEMAGLLGEDQIKICFVENRISQSSAAKKSYECEPLRIFLAGRKFSTKVLPPYRSGILQRSLGEVQEVLTIFLHCQVV